jgi:predicted small secreted protein
MNRFILFMFALALTLSAAACNTMEGLGQDIQKGGNALEKAARGNGGTNHP